MSTTTAKNMKYLLQKNDSTMSIVLSKEFKRQIRKASKRLGTNASVFAKLAIAEKLEREEENATIAN